MSVKPNAEAIMLLEQIIEDLPSGLTLKFERYPDGSDVRAKLTIFGNLPFGNREILFDATGAECGGGTSLQDVCRPSWLKEIK